MFNELNQNSALYGNPFTGTVPTQLASLTNLEFL